MKAALFCDIGVFIAAAVYNVLDFMLRPAAYEFTSAPWYTLTEVCGIFSAIAAALLLTGMFFLRRQMK